MNYVESLQRLVKRYTDKQWPVDARAFQTLPRNAVMTWAAELDKPDYQLQNWQYKFLIGEDRPNLHRQPMAERLGPRALGQVASLHKRTVGDVLGKAGVKV